MTTFLSSLICVSASARRCAQGGRVRIRARRGRFAPRTLPEPCGRALEHGVETIGDRLCLGIGGFCRAVVGSLSDRSDQVGRAPDQQCCQRHWPTPANIARHVVPPCFSRPAGAEPWAEPTRARDASSAFIDLAFSGACQFFRYLERIQSKSARYECPARASARLARRLQANRSVGPDCRLTRHASRVVMERAQRGGNDEARAVHDAAAPADAGLSRDAGGGSGGGAARRPPRLRRRLDRRALQLDDRADHLAA